MVINQRNRQKERKGRRPKRNQTVVRLKQKKKKGGGRGLVGPRAPWPPNDLDINERRVSRQNAKASLPNGANKL